MAKVMRLFPNSWHQLHSTLVNHVLLGSSRFVTTHCPDCTNSIKNIWKTNMVKSRQPKSCTTGQIATSLMFFIRMVSGLHLTWKLTAGAHFLEVKVCAQACAIMTANFAPRNTNGSDATCMVWASICRHGTEESQIYFTAKTGWRQVSVSHDCLFHSGQELRSGWLSD